MGLFSKKETDLTTAKSGNQYTKSDRQHMAMKISTQLFGTSNLDDILELFAPNLNEKVELLFKLAMKNSDFLAANNKYLVANNKMIYTLVEQNEKLLERCDSLLQENQHLKKQLFEHTITK